MKMSPSEARGYLMGWDTYVFGRRMTWLAWLVLFGAMCATGNLVLLIGLVTIPCFLFLSYAFITVGGCEKRAAEARAVLAAEPGKGEGSG